MSRTASSVKIQQTTFVKMFVGKTKRLFWFLHDPDGVLCVYFKTAACRLETGFWNKGCPHSHRPKWIPTIWFSLISEAQTHTLHQQLWRCQSLQHLLILCFVTVDWKDFTVLSEGRRASSLDGISALGSSSLKWPEIICLFGVSIRHLSLLFGTVYTFRWDFHPG